MNERAMRFRIGVFVLIALVLFGGLILIFGSLPALFQRTNSYTVRFTDAPGLAPGAPVRRSGVRIGEVRELVLDDERGIVRVKVAIDQRYTIRHNEQPTLVAGLLGNDASIDFVPVTPEAGRPVDRSPVEPGAELVGVRQASVNTLLNRASEVVPTTQETMNDVRKSLQRLERMAPDMEATMKEYRELARRTNALMPELQKTNTEYRELAIEARKALPDLRSTSQDVGMAARNWSRLGERLDVLVQSNQDKVVKAIDNLNTALTRVIDTLSPENQRNLTQTLRNLSAGTARLESIGRNADYILREGRTSVTQLNQALERSNAVLADTQRVSKPLGERGPGMVRNLDDSLDKLNRTLTDVQAMMRVLDQSDGTFRRFLTDPSLYQNVNKIACMTAALMPRLDRALRDLETFADKIARHPEVLGVGGVVRPGSGLKEPPLAPPGPHFFPGHRGDW